MPQDIAGRAVEWSNEVPPELRESVTRALERAGGYAPPWCRAFRVRLADEYSGAGLDGEAEPVIARPASGGVVECLLRSGWAQASASRRVAALLRWFLLDELARSLVPFAETVDRLAQYGGALERYPPGAAATVREIEIRTMVTAYAGQFAEALAAGVE